MSYETNPILNRTRIIKGWKNSTFPTKILNYTGQMTLWFKIYLFLKVYFWSQNIRLLTCEIRTAELHNKILYLSLKKHIPEKKNNKSKWKTTSFLQKLKSPLTKIQNKKARFLLYQDWKTWKHKSEFFFNTTKKKTFSQAWLTKPRFSSWINFSHILHFRRQCFRKNLKLLWKKKLPLMFKKTVDMYQNQMSNFLSKKGVKKNIGYQTKKDRILSHAFFKIQKNIQFLKQTFPVQSWNRKLLSYKNLKQQYITQKNNLSQIQKIHTFFCQKNREKLNFNLVSKQFTTKTLKKKNKIQNRNCWFFEKNQQENLQKKTFFKYSKTKLVFFITSNLWKKTFKKNFFLFLKFNKKDTGLTRLKNQIFFLEIMKNLWVANLRSTLLAFKIRRFTKLFRQQKSHLFEFFRFEQKKIRLNTIQSQQHLRNQENFSYRVSVRKNYLNYLKQSTNLKFKYLIENLIQQYFSIPLKIKLIWPLTQFKNVKFQRLFFPQYKHKAHKLLWTLNKNLKLQNKRYLYVGQNTNHLQKKNQIAMLSKKFEIFRKLNHKPVCASSLGAHWNTNMENPILAGHFSKEKKKKNKYLRLKTKVIRSQNEKRVSWLSKQKFISNLTTTLSLFAKYLEPQTLADHLAELVGTTKKHATILKLIKIALRTLRLKRGLGYRIALVGRINGTNKSRTFYLKKLNKNYARHTFSKNVNFAMSQARATIGAFCIKIWVYS